MPIITHPNNVSHEEVQDVLSALPVEIITNEHIPERNVEQVWRPPDNRFWSGDAEDDWMRTICEWTGDSQWGWFEQIDKGPLLYWMDDSAFRFGGPGHVVRDSVL